MEVPTKMRSGCVTSPGKCPYLRLFVSWDMYFLIVAALFIANQLTNQNTEISMWAVQTIMPIVSGLGTVGFYVFITVITLILTNIGNNMAMGFTILSVIGIIYNAGLQFDPIIAAILVTIICLLGYMFPSSSIGGAIIHANEWCEKKMIYKYVSISLVFGTIVLLAVIVPLGMLLF